MGCGRDQVPAIRKEILMSKITVIGIDPSFVNMGFARATVDLNTLKIDVTNLLLLKTESQGGKAVRKNSDDLRRAKELHDTLITQCKGCVIAMIEVPVNSQSARAAWTLGIALGVLAACPIPIIQLSPLQVKLASVGHKQASKQEMINWAVKMYPNAQWAKRKGVPIQSNEHLADAVGAIHAGIKQDDFQQLRAVLRGQAPTRVALK